MSEDPGVDKKQLKDIKVFDKAIKIIKSKPKKPKETLFTRKIIRYDIAINKYDVIGCAKVINELKIYFDGTLDNSKEKKKDNYIVYEATFLRALRNIAQLVSYHKGEKKHWENAADLMSMLGVSIKVFDLKMHGHIFDTWKNHTKH